MKRKTPHAFKDLVEHGIKRACRMIGYCLTILNEPAVWELSFILNLRLKSRQRVFLAVAALLALTDEEFEKVMEFMLGEE